MADPEDLYHIQQVFVHAYAGKWVKCNPEEAAGSLRQLLAAVSCPFGVGNFCTRRVGSPRSNVQLLIMSTFAQGDLEEYIPHDDFVALQDAATALEESAGLVSEPNGAQQGASPPAAPADAAAPNGTANGTAAGKEPRADSAEADGAEEPRPKKKKEKTKRREAEAGASAMPAKRTKKKSKGTADDE